MVVQLAPRLSPRPGTGFEPLHHDLRQVRVPTGKTCNGDDGAPVCSPYLFPWICQDPDSGFSIVTNRRPKRQAQTGAKWERAGTTQCNAWLKRMLSALNGSVNTEYTFHGTRAVATLVALANDRSIEQINKQQGWQERSDMCIRYARLQQVQCFFVLFLGPIL